MNSKTEMRSCDGCVMLQLFAHSYHDFCVSKYFSTIQQDTNNLWNILSDLERKFKIRM